MEKKTSLPQLHPGPDWLPLANFALANFSYLQSLGLVGREETTCAQGEKISAYELPLALSFL